MSLSDTSLQRISRYSSAIWELVLGKEWIMECSETSFLLSIMFFIGRRFLKVLVIG
jgi:hypothetical protein